MATGDNLWRVLTTCYNFVTTGNNLWQIVTTWINLDQLEQYYLENNHQILNELQILEKCDRQTEDGVSDNASTREACASKNVYEYSFTASV